MIFHKATILNYGKKISLAAVNGIIAAMIARMIIGTSLSQFFSTCRFHPHLFVAIFMWLRNTFLVFRMKRPILILHIWDIGLLSTYAMHVYVTNTAGTCKTQNIPSALSVVFFVVVSVTNPFFETLTQMQATRSMNRANSRKVENSPGETSTMLHPSKAMEEVCGFKSMGTSNMNFPTYAKADISTQTVFQMESKSCQFPNDSEEAKLKQINEHTETDTSNSLVPTVGSKVDMKDMDFAIDQKRRIDQSAGDYEARLFNKQQRLINSFKLNTKRNLNLLIKKQESQRNRKDAEVVRIEDLITETACPQSDAKMLKRFKINDEKKDDIPKQVKMALETIYVQNKDGLIRSASDTSITTGQTEHCFPLSSKKTFR